MKKKKINVAKEILRKSHVAVIALIMLFMLVAIPVPVSAANETFAAGSLIIPMDTTYQDDGMWKAYGLLFRLLDEGVPVSWAISNTKNFNGTDFTASTTDLRTEVAIGSHSYSGGPFVIDSADASKAETIIRDWWAASNKDLPVVHKATASFNANVDITLRSPPRIALEDENSKIAIPFFNAAGIPDLEGKAWRPESPNILNQEKILNGALFERGACSERKFDVFVTPHNGGYKYKTDDPNDDGTKTYAELDYFVNQGGGWVAMCHSIFSNENAIADLYRNGTPAVRALFNSTSEGGFLTKDGFKTKVANKGKEWFVAEPKLPVAQAVETNGVQTIPKGSVKTWDRTAVEYHSQTEMIAHFKEGGEIYDWAINGVAHDGQALGKVTFLGGHTFSTSLPYSKNTEAPYLRFFFNALFFNGSAVSNLKLRTSVSGMPQGRVSEIILSLENTGSSIATNTQDVKITLPSYVTYEETLNNGKEPSITRDGDKTILNWGGTLGDIPANSTAVEIKIKVSLSSDTVGDIKIANLVAKYGDVYKEAFTANMCRSLEVYPAPNPSIIKTTDPETREIYPGNVAKWTLAYQNTGQADLLDVVVEDILPIGFDYKTSDPEPETRANLEDGRVRLRWYFDTLPAGESGTINLEAYGAIELSDPKNAETYPYVNNAVIRGRDNSNFSYEDESSAEVTVIEPNVNISKSVSPEGFIELTDDGKIRPEGQDQKLDYLTYSMRPYYAGDNLLVDAKLTDVLPNYTAYLEASANADGNYIAETNEITWELGSNTEAVEGVKEVPGRPDCIYALQGGGTQGFYQYDIAKNSWSEMADVPGIVNTGGALTTDGTYIYALQGGGTSGFYRYDIAKREWIPKKNIPVGVSEGGALTIAGNSIYALQGGDTTGFYQYDIANNSWSAKENIPREVKAGGALTTDGTYIYALQGDKKDNRRNFYRYDIANNSWSKMADIPKDVKAGGALTIVGNSIYALRGNDSRNLYVYDIATNKWSEISKIPKSEKVKANAGAALTTDGTHIYTLWGGGTTDFYQYDIANNEEPWSAKLDIRGAVNAGGALTFVPGAPGKAYTSLEVVNKKLVTSGRDTNNPDEGTEITVRFTAKSSTATSDDPISNITPGDLVIESTSGASAILVNEPEQPRLISDDTSLTSGEDEVIYEWTYLLYAGENPGSLTFTVDKAKGQVVTGGETKDLDLPEAKSYSILVTPPLTFKVTVDRDKVEADQADQIENFARFSDSATLISGYDSNHVFNKIKRPNLQIEKQSSISEETFVNPGGKITYTLILRNEGDGTARDVEIRDQIPVNSNYIVDTATIIGSSPDITGLSFVEPSGDTNELVYHIPQLKQDEFVTMTFDVRVDCYLQLKLKLILYNVIGFHQAAA